MKMVIIVQARIHSKRMPKKILQEICGKTVLERVVDRCKLVQQADEVIVACPTQDELPIYERTGIVPHPGPEHDLVVRLLETAKDCKATKFARVTADCPLIDPGIIGRCLSHSFIVKKPIVCNWVRRKYPNGMDVEVYDVAWFDKWASQELSITDREWFPLKLAKEEADNIHSVECAYDASRFRLTVDYPADLMLVREVQFAMGKEIWGWERCCDFLRSRPDIYALNVKYNDDFGQSIR